MNFMPATVVSDHQSADRQRAARRRVEQMHLVHVERQRHRGFGLRIAFGVDTGAHASIADGKIDHSFRPEWLYQIDLRLDFGKARALPPLTDRLWSNAESDGLAELAKPLGPETMVYFSIGDRGICAPVSTPKAIRSPKPRCRCRST